MKIAMDWIKSNPFIVACGGVAIIGLAACGYLLFFAAPGFTEARSEPLKKYGTQQRSFMDVSVPVPNEDPNAPPDDVSVVVNEQVIKKVSSIYNEIKTQYSTILLETSEKNAKAHRGLLLGGDEIWPDADPQRFFALYEKAAADYRDHFKAAFSYGKPNPWGIAAMRASSPPSEAEIAEVLSKSAFEFLGSIGVTSSSTLTENQAKQLFAEQRGKLMQKLTERAGSIHIYADLPRDQDPFAPAEETEGTGGAPGSGGLIGGGGLVRNEPTDNGLPAGYPFLIAPWAYAETAPKPDELWEGQVQLWIMRDIMQAIARMNNVTSSVQTSVLDNPIKRLRRIEDIPGYVGIHTIGGAFLESNRTTSDNARPGARPGGARPGFAPTVSPSGSGVSGAGGVGITSIYPAPPPEVAPKDPNVQAPEHFGITPTGRISNAVFDVRHTKLTIDIEWAELPRFMDELRATNFMTVIDAEVQDLDEYKLLREGYVYGSADVVRAELLIESLWFREWTGPLMPKIVRQRLLIEPPANSGAVPSDY